MRKYNDLINEIINEPYILEKALLEIQNEYDWAKRRCLNVLNDNYCRTLLVCMYLLDKTITENDKTKTQHAIVESDEVKQL